MGKTCTEIFFLFVLFFYNIYPEYKKEKRDSYVVEHSCKTLYMYILTGLSFFVLCLGVFRSPLNTSYDKQLYLLGHVTAQIYCQSLLHFDFIF